MNSTLSEKREPEPARSAMDEKIEDLAVALSFLEDERESQLEPPGKRNQHKLTRLTTQDLVTRLESSKKVLMPAVQRDGRSALLEVAPGHAIDHILSEKDSVPPWDIDEEVSGNGLLVLGVPQRALCAPPPPSPPYRHLESVVRETVELGRSRLTAAGGSIGFRKFSGETTAVFHGTESAGRVACYSRRDGHFSAKLQEAREWPAAAPTGELLQEITENFWPPEQSPKAGDDV